jgi:hypothetical protein
VIGERIVGDEETSATDTQFCHSEERQIVLSFRGATATRNLHSSTRLDPGFLGLLGMKKQLANRNNW